jgi:hypothetical protein
MPVSCIILLFNRTRNELWKPRASSRTGVRLSRLPTFLWYGTDRIQNDVSSNYYIVAYLFVATVTCLPSRRLATIRVIHIPINLHVFFQNRKRGIIKKLYTVASLKLNFDQTVMEGDTHCMSVCNRPVSTEPSSRPTNNFLRLFWSLHENTRLIGGLGGNVSAGFSWQ